MDANGTSALFDLYRFFLSLTRMCIEKGVFCNKIYIEGSYLKKLLWS